MQITETGVVIGLAVIGAVLCSLLWIGRRHFGIKPRGRVADTALGAGIVASQHHGYTSVDSGSTGSAGVGGDGGGATP